MMAAAWRINWKTGAGSQTLKSSNALKSSAMAAMPSREGGCVGLVSPMDLVGDEVVAQVSKPAVSRVSKPADASRDGVPSVFRRPADLEVGDTAGLETCATPGLGAPRRMRVSCLRRPQKDAISASSTRILIRVLLA